MHVLFTFSSLRECQNLDRLIENTLFDFFIPKGLFYGSLNGRVELLENRVIVVCKKHLYFKRGILPHYLNRFSLADS